MKIVGTIFLDNRQLIGLSVKKARKYVKSTLALCRNPKNSGYCMIIFTGQDKTGRKYDIIGNIKMILTRFINEGKCSIQFKQPEHDLYVNADVIQLKGFLHLLKRILENKLTGKEITVSSLSVTPFTAKDIAPTKLTILKRSDYPTRFSRTLEELHINDIQRCGVDKGIFNLVNLKILDLSNNCIEFIPDELNILKNLQDINFSYNNLGKSAHLKWNWLKGNLCKSLQALDISHNDLVRIPNEVFKLFTLGSLNVNSNRLEVLPTGIGNLLNLKVLSISNNNLKTLPGTISRLRLLCIDLSNNPLKRHVPNDEPVRPLPVPVRSLKEYAAKQVLFAHIPYGPGDMPLTVIDYLDAAEYCTCGRPFFKMPFVKINQHIMLGNIAENVNILQDESSVVTAEFYYCSQQCYYFNVQRRARHPIIR